MTLIGNSWFGIASANMDWAAGRQKVIAENVANADTAGYVGRDVVSFADHLARSSGERRSPDVEEASNSWGGSFDGNRVVLEEQMMLSNEAASSYQLAAKLYAKGHELIALSVSSN